MIFWKKAPFLLHHISLLHQIRGTCFVILAACLAVTLVPAASFGDPASRPNVLIIVADDLGYADIGIHGGCEVSTPAIDRLALSGVRCTSGYVSSPYCSPSRAGLLTGRYPTRFGHEFNPHRGDEKTLGLPLSERTLANYLQEAGYVTAAIGKWHLGYGDAWHPQSRGFDHFYGFLVGAHNFQLRPGAKPVFGPAQSQNLIWRGRERQEPDGHTTRLFTDEALQFIRQHREHPWFLYLAFNAVHTPLEIEDRHRDRIPDTVTDPQRRGYLSLLLGLDEAVGRIGELLNEPDLRNTLIIFLSDNGGSGRKPFFAYNTGVNRPFRGDKGQTLEGGIRVPFFVSWPGTIPAGQRLDHPVMTIDIVPTVCAVADPQNRGHLNAAHLHGTSILRQLMSSSAEAPHEALYWRFGPQKAIRQGPWKLVDWRDFETGQNSGWQLYQLDEDPGEQNNLAEQHPELVEQLSAKWVQWNSGNVAPVWRGTRHEDPM